MAVELTWTESSALVEEPFDNTAGTTYTFTLKNIGSNATQGVGFYLKPASLEGEVSQPSTDGILSDWYDVLTKGEIAGSPGPGFHLIQDVNDDRFNFSQGDAAERPIPLKIGSGTEFDQLSPGEEVEIQLQYIPEVGDPTRRLYVEVALVYVEV